MREWYDGYRFAKNTEETVYNTVMVLYFLDAAMPNKPMPDDLIDDNVRIDYGKLRHLLTVSRGAPGGYPSQARALSRGARGDTPRMQEAKQGLCGHLPRADDRPLPGAAPRLPN